MTPYRIAIASLVAVTAGTMALIVRGGPPSDPVNLLLLAMSFAAYAGLVLSLKRAPGFPAAAVFLAILVLFAVAVGIRPRNSNDVYAYASYGRLIAEYQANPYERPPSDFAGDHYVQRLAREWLPVRTVYGPAFTGLSAVAMEVLPSRFAARVFFQALAAVAMLAALWVVWLLTRDVGTVAFAGLHPVVAASIVNGGHNDVLVGLAILGGVALAARARYITAGIVLALGGLVKIVGGLALAAVAWWVWRRVGRAAALRVAIAGGVVTAAAYLAVGPFHAIDALRDAARYITRFTVARAFAPGVAQNTDEAARIVSYAGIAMAVITVVLVIGYARSSALPAVAAVSVVTYLLVAAYVLPWYVAWALPVAALQRSTTVARIAAAAGAALMLVYWPTRAQYPGDAWFVSAFFAKVGYPLFALYAIVRLAQEARGPIVTVRAVEATPVPVAVAGPAEHGKREDPG